MNKQIRPTDSELEILNILWAKGPSTVREIHEVLEQNKEAGYTTSLKLLQIMHEKGLVSRDTSSKTHVYKAAIPQEKIQGQLVQRFIDNVFNGSASQLVMQALGSHKADAAELELIREYLDKMEQQNKK
ncbi:MAG: BlaI/MecI/CopY family transcriptional regulator [Flavipsychrobacter sp.]